MFLNTRPHSNILNGYQYSIRTGIRLPSNAVNLAYYYNKPLSPADNVVISDTSKFVLENVNQEYDNELIMYPDTNGILSVDGISDLDSELFEVTDKFCDGVPLYYGYRLYYRHYDKVGPNSLGEYTGDSIYLIGLNNKPISKNRYKYSIYLKPDPANPGMYYVYIYTAFLLKNENIMRCVYNAIVEKTVGGVTEYDVIPAYEERINPQPFFNSYQVLPGSVTGNIQTNVIKIDSPLRIQDTRQKINFSYIVRTSDGSFSSSPVTASVVKVNYALPHEKELFIGKSMIVSPRNSEGKLMTAKEIILRDNPGADLSDKLFVVSFDTDIDTAANKNYINLSTDPDGNSGIIAETTKDTGIGSDGTGKIDVPNMYKIEGSDIVAAYGVKKKDHRQILVKLPTQEGVFENWYPRIQYGRFSVITTENGNRVKYYYTLPEYNRELYSAKYGKPYVDIVDEKPKVLNSRVIKTKFYPLYVELEDMKFPKNLTVNKKDAYGNVISLSIASWNCTDGIIELDSIIKENDELTVSYTYEEQTFTYRGFIDETINDFVNLDLNPMQYHMVKVKTAGIYKDIPAYYLFNFVINIWMRPVAMAYLDNDDNETLNTSFPNVTNAIYHRFDNDDPIGPNDILLGKIYVRHNTTVNSIQLTDTRVRGGGVIESMYEPLRKQLEPESDYYWDIGYWDGEPYSENAVVIIRLDRRILKDYGGRFTPQEVEKAVNKFIAYGVLPIIEYVATYSSDNAVNRDIKVESTYKNKLNFRPIFSVDLFNQVVVPDISIDSVYKSAPACGIIKLIEEDMRENIICGEQYEANHRLDTADIIGIHVERKLMKQPVGILKIVDTSEYMH